MNRERNSRFDVSWKHLGTECSESFSRFSEVGELPREAEPCAGFYLIRGLCCNWADMIYSLLPLSSCTVIMDNSLNGFIIFKCQRALTLLSVYVTVLITNSKIPLAQNCNVEYKLDYYISEENLSDACQLKMFSHNIQAFISMLFLTHERTLTIFNLNCSRVSVSVVPVILDVKKIK